jgi:hypothetical protein
VSSVGFWGITYGNGLYVAVGRHDTTNASVIYTSPDFVTWTSRTTPFSVNCRLTFVYWSGDKFITGGAFGGLTDGQAAYSTDGITWNLLTLPGSHGPIECGIYSADLGVYLMGTSNSYGDILRSTDGISWTRYSIGVAIDGLVWNPDSAEFLSVGAQTGSGGETWTSPDGINWTHRSTQGGVSYGFLDVIWDGSKYYASAVGDPTVRGVWESSDHGDIWTQNPDGTNNFGYCIAYIAGTYIVGNAAGNIMVSTDGIDFANANCGISGSVECIHAYYGL